MVRPGATPTDQERARAFIIAFMAKLKPVVTGVTERHFRRITGEPGGGRPSRVEVA